MPTRRRTHNSSITAEIQPVVRLWILRMLILLGLHRKFIGHEEFGDDAVARALGLGDWVDSTSCDFDPKLIRNELRKLHSAAEKECLSADIPPLLHGNVKRLAKLVGLSDTDRRILEFSVLLHSEQMLTEIAENLGTVSFAKACHVLSALLDLPESDVRTSLNSRGALSKSGLLAVDFSGDYHLPGKLNLLSDTFANRLISVEADPLSLLRDTIAPSAPAKLGIADYDHVSPSLAVLRPYLRQSIAAGRKGVNVLIYGDSGTGKSELTRTLAAEMGCDLFEVSSQDEEGDPVDGQRRLRAFRAAQSFFCDKRALIVFDEIEDVFNDGESFFGNKSTAQIRKGWVNRMLEENSIPTLWLSNSIDGLDSAFIRRFDIVIELPVPPKRKRERIIEAACVDLLDSQDAARFAESNELAPAIITRAASVVRPIRAELGIGVSTAMELLINNTLRAQGHSALRRNDPHRLPEIYDPAFIHADADLLQVAAGLAHSKAGRLCLYGPPGTGKTAFARWLADQIGIPVLVKKGSDLMSKWLGDNEKNIARAFRSAEQNGALLLIDEVDSFLQDRRGAVRSWEVTLVNEMLTQMESFSGVFIASTNLMDNLDQAALRRFDLKVQFDYLTTEQRVALLRRYCDKWGLSMPLLVEESRLTRLQMLTPGDFAAVGRQNLFRPLSCTGELIDRLESECAVKEGSKAAIGFIH